ncbi:MAG: hypothetical protein MZU97_07780 [Bacillus subtilis]|nr:hypothetical protein [Bacillus subtilis]
MFTTETALSRTTRTTGVSRGLTTGAAQPAMAREKACKHSPNETSSPVHGMLPCKVSLEL